MPTFKSGVESFWKWFPTVADRFYETINDGKCSDLGEEVSQFMQVHLPGLAWSFGPGVDDGHSFTLSGDGIPAKQLLAHEWIECALAVRGWTFHSSRQPGSLDSVVLEIPEAGQVNGESLLIQTNVDEESEVIDITAWHETFAEIPEDAQHQILFLMLDEALGEFGTQTWIGNIDLKPLQPSDEHTRPLARLPEYISSVEAYHKWEKHSPMESYSSYQLPEPYPGPRGDTLVGTTLLPHPFIDFIVGDGKLEDNPLADTGAQLAYIAFDASTLPVGDQANARAKMEDAIDEVLQEKSSGRVLGGAHGSEQAYIDLLLFDAALSLAIAQEQISRLQIPSATLHVID